MPIFQSYYNKKASERKENADLTNEKNDIDCRHFENRTTM